jgi:hypothetical protein
MIAKPSTLSIDSFSEMDTPGDSQSLGPKVVLEDFVGLEYHDARVRAIQSGLWLMFADPDHPPQGMCIVMRQEVTKSVRALVARVSRLDCPRR